MKSISLICLQAATIVGIGSRTGAFTFTKNYSPSQQKGSRRRTSSVPTSIPLISTDDEFIQSSQSATRIGNFSTIRVGDKTVASELSLHSESSDNSINNSNNNSLLPAWAETIAWRLVIVALCAIWASNFAVAKLVMAEPGVDSSLYALSRFGVAATALAPFAIWSVNSSNTQRKGDIAPIMDWEIIKEAITCGSWVAVGYIGQTLGLMTTTSSKSCVICSMHCVFVAIIAEIWRVQKCIAQDKDSCSLDNPANQFDVKTLLPAAIAILGVAVVELKGAGGRPTIGDAFSFAQPIGFGAGYLILEKIMTKRPEAALPVSAIKLAVVTLSALIMFETSPILLNGGTTNDLAFRIPDFTPILVSPVATAGILYTGLVTTALALWVESIAFVKVPATDASLILTTEPLFAAGCGAVALGETFSTSDYIGATLIVGACILSIFIGSSVPKELESTPTAAAAAAAAAELQS